jgi:hypothetical protein
MSSLHSNWNQNCFSAVNKSPSKMSFSFSKANRFSSEKENKYLRVYSGRRSFTMWRLKLIKGLQHLDMAISTILLKSKI